MNRKNPNGPDVHILPEPLRSIGIPYGSPEYRALNAPPKQPKKTTPEQRFRAKLWTASGFHCCICGKRIKNALAVTIEHTYPKSRGYGNPRNRTAAHTRCNAAKGNRMPTGCELVWLDLTNSYLRDHHTL